MSVLFEPMKIKNMELQNRFVRSATIDGSAGRASRVSESQIRIYNDLARGGVGLIITGATFVHHTGQRFRSQNSIADDDCIPGLKRLTASAHRHGAKIAVQLFHAGREGAVYQKSKNRLAIAPSVIDNDPYYTDECRSMTEDEIWSVIRAFGDGAERAREAGFDAVQIHGAHGYLLSQFLSPFTNRRRDQWGGSLKNRIRIHRAIYEDIRGKVGEDYPVLIKMGVQDAYPGGLDFSEGKLAVKSLIEMGFDAFEISSGLRGTTYDKTEFRIKIDRLDREAYYRKWCRDIKKELNIPIMIVGGLRTFDLMEEIVQKKESDFISLSRPLIREPNIIDTWKSGDRHRAKCISCNRCLEGVRKGEKLRCFQEEKTPK